MRGKFSAGLLLLVLSAFSLRAADSDWFYRSWQTDDGLPNNTVGALAQTPDGYLWLGTPSGLVRFDGIRFEDFSPTNFVSPPNRGTVVMLRGSDRALWLALDRGAIVRLDGGAARSYTGGLTNLIPNGLAEDADGALWVAYRGGSVYRIKEGQVRLFGSAEGLPPGNDICALTRDNQGHVWFAKAGQLGQIRGGLFETNFNFDALPARLTAANAGGVWLCAGHRLLKVDEKGKARDFGRFDPKGAGTIATALLEDHEGAVWIGTSYSGLYRHGDSGFEPIQTAHEEILSLVEDREGNLWVGTSGGGLNRIRRRAIELEGTESGLPFGAVQSICQDAAGTLWAATQNGGLARRVEGRWTALAASESWPTDATCVTADAQGSVWIGTRLHGLYCWRDGSFLNWGDAKKLRGQTLHTLLASREGELWLGEETPNAVQALHEGKLRTFEVPQGVRVIRAMAEDAQGNIWAGTSQGVLFRITTNQISNVTPRPGPPESLASIRCLYVTADGALWIGYAGWGVGRLKGGRYAEIRTEHGLYDDYISHIVADNRGWLWFGANLGIFKVRQESLEDLAEGRATRVRSIHYGKGEGLPSLQGNFGDSPDVLRSRDGKLWIPMRSALAVVDPEKLGESSEPPPTVLNRVSMDERTVARYRGVLPPVKEGGATVLDLGTAEARLRLPPAHRRLEFEFAALSFTAPENVQFRYRLENFDDDWVEAGTKRTAPYPRLAAGDYVFRVIACNSDGVWTKTGAVLAVGVTPFFWQTWYFRGATLAGFTLAVVTIVRYVSFRRLHRRLRTLEQQAALYKERARIAKDIHDDLGANLTQIALLGELAQQDRSEPEKAGERVNTISATARQAIKSLDEIVWAVNPRNDTLAHLVDYAGQFAVDYLRLAGIRCRLDFPEQPPPREVSTDIRHNLFLAIKEALNNIVKHSQASEAWLRVQALDGSLQISVEDNGRGFERAPDDALADGLRNMRQRLEEIGGECRVQSQPGGGTQIMLVLPWPHT